MSDSPEHPSERRLRDCPAYFRIEFDPVPVRPRHDGWTAERQRGFIDRLVVTGCVARSARALGLTPQSADKLRKHPGGASFRRAWDEALASGRSYQRNVALERAVMGETIPIMYRGRRIGVRTRYDNSLAIAALNAAPRTATEKDPADALHLALAALEAEAAQDAPSLETKDFLAASGATSSTLRRDHPDQLLAGDGGRAEKALVEVATFAGEKA